MNKYYIKQNGFIIGTATGKKKAVEYIEKILKTNKIKEDDIWFNDKGFISVENGVNRYTIERE